MGINLEVAKADLAFEAGFPQPEFGLFQDTAALLHHLFKHLEPHGLRLNDIRVERGTGNMGDQQIVCYLFNYWMTVRIRIERIEHSPILDAEIKLTILIAEDNLVNQHVARLLLEKLGYETCIIYGLLGDPPTLNKIMTALTNRGSLQRIVS